MPVTGTLPEPELGLGSHCRFCAPEWHFGGTWGTFGVGRAEGLTVQSSKCNEAPNERPGPGVLSAQSERCLQSRNTRTSIIPQPRLREGLSTPLISFFRPCPKGGWSSLRPTALQRENLHSKSVDSVRDQMRFRAANTRPEQTRELVRRQGVVTVSSFSPGRLA